MPYYETVLIARQELTEQQVKELADTYAKVITDNGGKIHKIESWGLRNLAYRIRKNRKGHYMLIESDTPPAALHEMERQMRLSDDVLRFLTVREEKLSEGPSAILNKDTRDSDGFDGREGRGRDRDRDRDRDRGDREGRDYGRSNRSDKEAA